MSTQNAGMFGMFGMTELNEHDLEVSNYFKNLNFNSSTGVPKFQVPVDKVNYPKVVFSIIFCLFGLFGNSIVLFVILALREFKKDVTHWYVLQLAIADSLFLLTLPFKTVEDLSLRWPFPEWMCKGKETILFLNYYASITFLMVMSIDRYLAVCHMFSDTVARLRKLRVAITVSICVWIVCLCLCIPIMLYSAKVGSHPDCSCSYVFPKDIEPTTRNITQECLDKGYSTNEMDLCVKVLTPGDGGTQHCVAPSDSLGDVLTELLFGGGFGNDNSPFSNFNAEGSASDANPFRNIDPSTLDMSSLFKTNVAVRDFAGSGQGPQPDSTTQSDQTVNATAGDSTNSTLDDQDRQPDASSVCSYANTPTGWKVFMLFNFLAMYVVPVVVMVACYGLIVKRLSLNNRPSGTSEVNNKSASRAQKNRKRVTIMCAALVSCFVIFWLPFHVGHLIKLVGITVAKGQKKICHNLAVAGSLMAYLSSALNPYLYTILGGNFSTRWNDATKGIRRRLESHTKSTHDQHASTESGANKKTGVTSADGSNSGKLLPTGGVERKNRLLESSDYTNSESTKQTEASKRLTTVV